MEFTTRFRLKTDLFCAYYIFTLYYFFYYYFLHSKNPKQKIIDFFNVARSVLAMFLELFALR